MIIKRWMGVMNRLQTHGQIDFWFLNSINYLGSKEPDSGFETKDILCIQFVEYVINYEVYKSIMW